MTHRSVPAPLGARARAAVRTSAPIAALAALALAACGDAPTAARAADPAPPAAPTTAAPADTLPATVIACGAATADAPQATPLAVGEVRAFAAGEGADLCLPGGAEGAEYAVVPFSAAQTAAATVTLDVTPTGVTALAAAAAPLAPLGTGRLSLARAEGAAAVTGPTPDAAFHHRLRATAHRELLGRMDGARATFRARRGGAAPRLPGGPSLARIGAGARVGDLVSLNTSDEPCKVTPGAVRGGRVAAVTDRAIVVADTLNPAGGFTDAEYRAFGVAFDTLAHPVNVETFGAPSDIDGNGKVVIFFTSAVNALTPRGASYYVGGFFFSRDLFPRDGGESAGGCAGSNEAEMFYMLVPDPTGAVNGNRRSKAFVAGMTVSTIGHEMEHLVNSSRRVHVNDASGWEASWLDEGLAHVAEELIFYRASGLSPRTRLTSGAVRATERARTAFNEHMLGNVGRLAAYLEAPTTTSPFAADDDLATRGAAWSFLRYAADRHHAAGGREAELWSRLVNARTSGRANLAAALGGANLDDWFRDWSLSALDEALGDTVGDARAAAREPRYAQASWDFPEIYAALDGAYPLATQTLADGQPQRIALNGGAAAYLRLAVAPGARAAVRTRAGSSALPATVRVAVVRTR